MDIGRSIAALVCVGLLAGSAARADQTDPALDGLFADLKAAESGDAARPIEARIWGIWLQSNDKSVDELMAHGVALMDDSALDEALAVFDQIVAKSPRFAEGWNKRATVLYLLGRFDESRHDIDHVLALEPRHFGALSGLGLCDVRLKQAKAALDAFRRAQAVDPMMSGVRDNIDALVKMLAGESI